MPSYIKKMKAKGIKQKDIADKLGVTQSAVSLVAHGKSRSQKIEDAIKHAISGKFVSCSLNRFGIYKKGKLVDKAYFQKGITEEDVKNCLIIHNIYDADIEVQELEWED